MMAMAALKAKIRAILFGERCFGSARTAICDTPPNGPAALLGAWFWRLAVLWTLLLLVLGAWRFHSDWSALKSAALNLAEESYRKDILYRRWVTLHGGVYAPATEQTPPNPYLVVPERDIAAPSGKALTLINPDYMTRQVHELAAEAFGVRAHLTSLNPVQPGNAPDAWERQALLAFGRGEKESVAFEVIDGESYLRFMRPMIAEKGCLKCHAAQGYREGDIRGGISVSIPWRPYRRALSGQIAATVAGYGAVWGLGLLGLTWLRKQLVRYIGDRQRAETALRQSEEKFAKIFQSTPDVVVISRASDGLLLEVNPGFEIVTGYTRLEAIGRSTLDLRLWSDPVERERLVTDLRLHGQVLHRFISFRRKEGEPRIGQFSARPITIDDEHCLLFVMQDVTERQRVEQELRVSEERYRLLFERSNDAIFIVEKSTGRYLDANRAAETLTGRALAEIIELRTTDLTPVGASARLCQAAEMTDAIDFGEVVYLRPDGAIRTALLSVIPISEDIMFGIARDITEIKVAEQRVEHLAYYDGLTDLPNRTLLAQRAKLALALAARYQRELTVLFLDLDRFKEVNDSLGHAEGDTLLVEVAARIQGLVRSGDTVCRLGGDEFVLLLPDTGKEGALRVADKLLAAFRQPFAVAGHSLGVTVSVGIALYPHDGADFDELLKNADTALYRAKQEGRNTRLFYDRGMNAATFERLVLEGELRQAVATGQLRAYYQPKVRLADGGLAGAEALMRWQHPDRGLVPPGQFIPVAEASDLIVALGDWMLVEVCRQMAAWRKAGLPPLTVAVNLAGRHFRLPQLADRAHGLLEAYGLPPQVLVGHLLCPSPLMSGSE
jgi:diguanylate cyclase (GGDEF)-like protein/PAS domain S-box-containing protein